MGIRNIDNCKRQSNKDKTYIQIPRPELIKNWHFGCLPMQSIACVDSWLEYKQMATTLGVKKKDFGFLYFRAKALILFHNQSYKNWRDVRLIENICSDRVDHLPKYNVHEYGARCKFPNCKSKSRPICSKCNVYLSYTKNFNCFLNYHKK